MRVEPHIVRGWWKDTGRLEDMLEANRLILDNLVERVDGELIDSQVDGRVVIEAGARLERTTVRGPAIIGAGARAERLLHRPLHGDRRALHDHRRRGRALDPAAGLHRRATSTGAWSPRCSGATSACAAASASRARTASWSATTPTSRSCEAARRRAPRGCSATTCARRRARGRTSCRARRPARARHHRRALPSTRCSSGSQRARPLDGVVNCAAWTDVDGAEADARAGARGQRRRRRQPRARRPRRRGVPLLHVSTDYVFDGDAPLDADGSARPYVESDPTAPRSVYGQTKLEGEQQVLGASRAARRSCARAWLYGVGGAQLRRDDARALAGERDAVAGRHRPGRLARPGPGHLAPGAARAARARGDAALVHLAGGGDGLLERFRRARSSARPRSTAASTRRRATQIARPAPRPAWSALESERDDVLPLPAWQRRAGRLSRGAGWDDARHEAARLRRRRVHRLDLRAPAPAASTATRSRCSTSSPTPGARRTSTTSPSTRRFASCAARSRTRRRWPARSRRRRRRRSSTSPPRRTSTARSPSPTRSSRTHALGTYVLLEAARERGAALRAGLDRRGLRLDRAGLVHRGVARCARPRRTRPRRPARTCSCRATSTPTGCRR